MHDFQTRPFTWHMSLVFETGRGPYNIAGEAVIRRENLESAPDSRSPFQMIGLCMDFETKWRSKENIL
jgi:hypothetical protein